MKQVASRDFFRKPYLYLNDLPIVVTKNGVPTYKIESVVMTKENVVTKPIENVMTNNVPDDLKQEAGQTVKEPLTPAPRKKEFWEEDPPKKEPVVEMKWCDVCRNLKEGVHSVEYLDGDSRVTKNMCKSCEMKIPEDMRIKTAVPDYRVIGGGEEAVDLSGEVNPVPLEIREKAKRKGGK